MVFNGSKLTIVHTNYSQCNFYQKNEIVFVIYFVPPPTHKVGLQDKVGPEGQISSAFPSKKINAKIMKSRTI